MAEEQPLTFWVIYDHPLDYPNNMVVRPTDVYAGRVVPRANDVHLFDSLGQCRDLCRGMGLSRIPRDPRDEPQIVESWI